MITPIGSKVIIQPVEAETGKLLLPNAKPSQFRIIAIGDDVKKVKPNDIIYLEKHYGAEIKHDGQTYICIEEDTILAKLD